jgi:hypothetical protein
MYEHLYTVTNPLCQENIGTFFMFEMCKSIRSHTKKTNWQFPHTTYLLWNCVTVKFCTQNLPIKKTTAVLFCKTYLVLQHICEMWWEIHACTTENNVFVFQPYISHFFHEIVCLHTVKAVLIAWKHWKVKVSRNKTPMIHTNWLKF